MRERERETGAGGDLTCSWLRASQQVGEQSPARSPSLAKERQRERDRERERERREGLGRAKRLRVETRPPCPAERKKREGRGCTLPCPNASTRERRCKDCLQLTPEQSRDGAMAEGRKEETVCSCARFAAVRVEGGDRC